jgi:uronate dehydrogenase
VTGAVAAGAPVLVTGPGGRVGAGLRRHWGSRFPTRLFDLRPVGDLAPHESFVRGNIADLQALRAAAAGCRAMVHLAATSDEADFVAELMPNNVLGAYNAFEAARLEGVRRFVFASTVQVLLGHPRDAFVRDADPVRPVSRYACTKVLGEALGRYYRDRFGLEVVCLRLGAVPHPDRDDPSRGGVYLSPRDCAGFIAAAIGADPAPEDGFAIISITSRGGAGLRDLERAARLLGYRPVDGRAPAG